MLLLTFQETLAATQAKPRKSAAEANRLRKGRTQAKGSIEQGPGQKAVSSSSRTKTQRKGVSSRKVKASVIRGVLEPLAFQDAFGAAQAHPESLQLGQVYPAHLRL